MLDEEPLGTIVRPLGKQKKEVQKQKSVTSFLKKLVVWSL